jgi:hypothetical protein
VKRRPAFSSDQLAFTFEVPTVERHHGALAGLSREVSSAVARIIEEDGRARPVLAGALSEILGRTMTKETLDGWSSEGRDKFNVPFYGLLALVAVTDRADVLDALLRRVGVAVLVGEEIITAQLGHLDRQIAELQGRKKQIQQRAVPIGRATTGDA